MVLDSSRSLNATQIGQIRTAASQFINSLYDQINGGNNNGGTSAPTGVSATAQSSSGVSVSWTAASGATSYKVYWSESMYGTYELDGTTTITTSFISGEWYPSSAGYFKVTAVNSAGESACSSIVSATTSDAILLTSSSTTWTNGALSASSPDAWYRVSVPTSSYPYYLSGRDT
ncbi:MAG: fibronectin type III domain-containing protein [Treponema sp.]|nr:fibronectin type III domain-containing protein [Treponema sp.]